MSPSNEGKIFSFNKEAFDPGLLTMFVLFFVTLVYYQGWWGFALTVIFFLIGCMVNFINWGRTPTKEKSLT